MKHTLEEAAKEHQNGSPTCEGDSICAGFINGRRHQCYKSFIAGAKWQSKQSPWISVKDKLPDNQNIVLVRDEYGGFCTAYLHGPKSGFITYGEEAYRKFGEITHWIPIPPFESNDNE